MPLRSPVPVMARTWRHRWRGTTTVSCAPMCLATTGWRSRCAWAGPRPPRERSSAGELRCAWPGRSSGDPYTAQMTRVRILRIDPKVMLRFSLLLALCLWSMLLVASVVLWVVAVLTGTLAKVEDLFAQLLAERSFEFEPIRLLLGAAATGVVLLVTAAILSAIFSTLFNLVAGRIGGLEVDVAEIEPGG
ncbi:MAG: hypothetical protein EBX39_02325 [Actinobacteria bacterium]|nr:hypothetical protein [Actinomycetota bacterium]